MALAGADLPTCTNTITLAGNDVGPVGATGVWTKLPSSTAIIVALSLYNTAVNQLEPGPNQFTWTVTTAGGCPNSDDVIVTYNQVTANAGIDQETCNTTVNLAASGLGTWTQPAGNASVITNSTSASSSVTGLTTGSYTYRWTVVGSGCTATDDVVVTNSSTQTAIANTGAAEVCDGNGTLITNPLIFGETGLWTPFTASGTIANNTLTSTAVTGLGLGNNTFRWTITRGTNLICTSFANVLIANNQVTANAGADQDICTSTATLVGNNPLQGTGTWTTFGFNPAIIADATLYGTTVSNLSDNTSHGFTWTVTKGICGKSDDVYIRNNRIVAVAGLPISTCFSSFNLDGNDPGTGTGTWSVPVGSLTTFSNATLYNTTVNMLVKANPYSEVFTWTITNNGLCPSASTVTVNNNAFIVFANADSYTCDGTFSLLGRDPLSVSPTATGVWTIPSGSGIFTNSLTYNATVSGLDPGNNSLTWTISDKGCTAFDDVLITNDQVTATATGFMTCDNNTAITAVVNPITQGASGVWTVDNQTTQVVALPSAYITTVSGLVPNSINRLRWTVTRGACSVNDTMNIEYFVPNANITIPDIVHACSDTIQLIADSNIGTGTGAWSFGSTQVTIDDNTATTTIARKLEISNNVFRWTVSNRGCVKYDEVTINNSKPLNTAGSDQSACSNAFTMNAQTPTATGSGWWDLVSGTVTIADRSLATTTVTNVGTGTNILQWTITDKGCSSSKQFRITNNLTSPNAGVDVSVCENRVTLSGNSLKPGQTGLWSIDGGVVSEVFSSTSVNNPVVTNLRQGIITFAWTITNGTCTATDRVVVTNNTPTVDAGPDRIICDNFVTLAGNNPDPGNTGVWTIGNTNVVIANKTNYNTNITNLSQGSNLFTWTIDNGICTSSDNVLITSNSITVVAGIPYTEDCADTLYLEATVPPVGATGLWSAFGGGTVDNPTSYSTIARGLGADNTLRWTITAGTCSFYNEIKFVSLLPTKAATAIDKPVCTTSAQITANPASGVGESGLWTKVVGSSTVSIVNPTSFQTLVNNLDPGINVFRWTISNSQCSTSDLITITNNEVFADAGVDHIICDSAYSISANVTTGSGVWISTTPGVVIANSTSANTSVSKLRFGNNNFQWIVSYNGCTDVDEVIIKSDLPRNVSAGSDTSICSGTANLSGTNPGTGNSGLWQVTGGAGTFANSTTNQTIVTGLSTGGNIFKWTVTVGSCSASDQVSINNNSLYVTAGTNQAICNVNSLQLSGTIPGVGIIGTWSVNGGTGTFVNNSIFNTIVSNITKGTNTYRWTLTDGTCTNFADVEVVNNTPDPASVGPDTLICIDNHPLNAVIVANGTGSWSVTSGSATIANITSRNTSASGINKGLNTFTWTVNKNGCKLSDDINVTNNSVNVFANADFVTCTSAHDATIIGNVPVTGETGAWTKISAGPGVITTSANNVTTVTGLGNGGTIFRWTIANATCSLSDDVTITDNYYTTTAIANGYDNCVSFSQIQGGVVPSGASGIWSSTAADVTFDNNTSVLTWVRNLPGGTTSITWTITKDGCSSPASFSLLNNAIYTSAGADQIVCQTSTTLNAQALLGSETGKWVVVPNTVVITNTANPASAVSNLGPGNNTFTWTLSGNGCSVFDNVIISNNSFTVTAGSDQISCGSSYPLVASDPLGGTGLWTIGSGTGSFAAATNFATTVSNMNNGSNTFLWTAKRNGCTASDDVIITNDLYTATAGADRAICSNQTTVTAQPLNATWGTNGKWTAQTGGGVFVSPSSASSLVTGLANGENKLVWTVSKGTCVSFDEMIITNNSITATAGTPETTCNNFATLSATPLSATGVGLWSGGGVTTSIVTPTSATTNVINLQQGTNTFAWTVTDKGCTGTSTVQVISNFFRAFAGNDQTRTVDNALLTAQLPNPAATGTWSIFSGNGSFANINSGSSAVTLLGYGINTFRWTVDWNSCTSTDDVNIIYNSIAAEAGTDQTICTGNTFLTATAPFPGTGKWTIVQGFGKFMFDTEPNTEVTGILPGSVNIFRWTVSIGGFSTSDEVNIINGEFTISAGVPNPKETCIPQATMTAQSAGTGLGTWTVITGNGSFANANLETTLITNLSEGPNIFQWQVTKLNGCKDSATIQVNYNMPPTAAFEMNNTQGCSPVNVIFTNTSTGSGLDPLTSYYWNFGDRDTVAFTPNSRNYIALYDDRDSTSNITLVATNASGCKDTVTHQVTAFRIPFVEFYPSPISQTWPRSQVNFENTSNQNYPKYSWDFGDGKTQLDFAFNSNFSHDYPTWGTYTITLSVSSANCDADTQQTITINPPLPKNIGGRNYPGCAPFPVKFTNGTEYCDEWFWDFGDGGSSDSITPDYTYDTPGMYIVNLYGWGPGSPNSGPGKFGDPGYNRGDSTFIRKDTVYVFATPVADFLIKPDTVMLPNSEVRCYNRSTNADIYSWNFGDNGNEVFTEENPTHFYSETGTYYIILRVATNTNPQCYDDTINTMPIIVLPAGVCKFPNAFSPNPSGPSNGSWNDNDVSNDIFHPKHRGVDLYKLEIFNRWGEKIFESNDPAFGWDGYRDGKLLPQDVYVWKVTGRYRNGVPFKNAGDVTLIR